MTVVLVPYPFDATKTDPSMVPYHRGIKNGTITDLNGYDHQARFVQRTHNKARLDEYAEKHPGSVLFMGEDLSTGTIMRWSLLVPIAAPVDEHWVVWNDPYRHALEMAKFRSGKEFAKSDAVKRIVMGYWDAQVMFSPTSIRITNAE